MVFLILIAIWAVVLIPQWIQSRRDVAPARSMVTFQKRLSSLERTGVHYEAYSDEMYLDAPYLDRHDDGVGDDTEDVEVNRPTPAPLRRPVAEPLAPAAVAAPTLRTGSRMALQRRRQIFFGLALTWVVSLGTAALTSSLTVLAANGVASLLLFTYIGLLVKHHKRALEHAAKVRYLAPARTPRPAVVVLRDGAGAGAGGR